MDTGPINDIDEVSYAAIVEDSVVEIAGDTRGKQTEGNLYEPLPDVPANKNGDYTGKRYRRGRNQQEAFSGGDTEGGTGIFSNHKP